MQEAGKELMQVVDAVRELLLYAMEVNILARQV